MFALKVTINGEATVVAGVDDWSLLTASITATRSCKPSEEDAFELRIGGLVKQTVPGKHEHVRWPEKGLRIGDRVTIELLNSEDADLPRKRYRSDKTVQEKPFTEAEIQEMKRTQYLALKQEFENEGDA